MNKLRQWLLRPSLRAMLGQTEPKFEMRQVFTDRKILLVSLASGVIGPEAATCSAPSSSPNLAGHPGPGRRPGRARHPVMVYLDELPGTCTCRRTWPTPWPAPAAWASATRWPTSS